ncbi:MAG TPA: hypothetical protein DDX54_04075 [Rhodospirillaceae bacterium]|jgi:flagellar assembly protein FliH|nr:hypothetical protein [Alphaproteobacteria bacterium]HBH26562.1 hypothetical protein [Rhodospirillaceae bacterium]
MPAATARKFLFDVHSFEADEAPCDELLTQDVAHSPPPTFSEEELAAARAEGVAQGRAEALEELRTTEAQAASQALEAARTALSVLVESEAGRAALYESAAVRVAIAAFSRTFPALAAAGGLAEIQAAMEAALTDLGPHVGEVTLHVHPDHLPALAPLGVHLVPDEALGPADFRAAWAGGGAERDAGALAGAIAAALAPGTAEDSAG